MGSGTSKILLRDALRKLSIEDVPRSDKSFWSQFWRMGGTPQDIFEVIRPMDVRQLRAERLANLEALLWAAVSYLEKVLGNPDPLLFDGALTVIRVLTRLLPFLLESYNDPETGAVDSDLDLLFWGNGLCATEPGRGETDGMGGELGAAGEGLGTGAGTEDGAGGAGAGTEAGVGEMQGMLGTCLVRAVMKMLFIRQFTVDVSAGDPVEVKPGEEGYSAMDVHQPSMCWVPGLSVTNGHKIVSFRALESNRIEVMRLLVVLMSQPLFQPNKNFNPASSRFSAEVCKEDSPFAAELFVSLLSCVAGYDPIGWGVPYGSIFSSDLPVRQLDMAVQLLVVLLDSGEAPYPKEGISDQELQASEGKNMEGQEQGQGIKVGSRAGVGTLSYNVFRHLIHRCLKAEKDFSLLFSSMSRLLNNMQRARNSYIPGSALEVKCYQELLVLLWKLLEENPPFMTYVLKYCDVCELLVPICYLMVENRKDVSKGGLIHICTFILLKLSGERLFGVGLNKPFNLRLPIDLPLFQGTHVDLLIITLHKLVVAGSDRLKSLYHCFLTVLCNVSPYCKGVSLVTSVKLLNLLELFTSPGMLYTAYTNHTFVSLLLESFANVIQYQYGGNAHLIYAIVRRKKVFEDLFNLTLPAVVEDARAFAESISGRTAVCSRSPGPTEVQRPVSPQDGETAPGSKLNSQAAQPAQDVGARSEPSQSERLAPSPATPLRFQPTQAWLDQVRAEVPLNTILRLLQNLAPQVEEFCREASAPDEASVVDFITKTTMVGLLPVPHPIVIRKYHPNYHTAIWFTAFMWGVIFVRNQELPMFDGDKIRLFTVTTS